MKPRELCSKLNECFEHGMGEGVFMAIQPHLLRETSSGETLSPPNPIGMLSDCGISLPEYVLLLEEDRYSAVFDDYALLTVECAFVRGKLETHRYGYIPCPLDKTLMYLRPEDVPISDWIKESVLAEGYGVFRSAGTYRFDCVRTAPKKTADPHPVSHLTFGSPNCRLPVRAPLSPSNFLHFLFDNFYDHHSAFWAKYAPFLGCGGVDDTISTDELVRHHISWFEEV